MMKKYVNPKIDVVKIESADIITTSPGTETTPNYESDGVWDLNIGL